MNIDRIAKYFDPVVANLETPDMVKMRHALNVAVDPDGMINPDKIPVFTSHLMRLADESGTSASTTDTVNYSDAIVVDDFTIPDYGVWRVAIDAGGVLSNSGGTSVDVVLIVNGDTERSVSVTAPTIANGGAYCRLATVILNVASSTAFDIRYQIKCNSGSTSTARRLVMRVDADRMY